MRALANPSPRRLLLLGAGVAAVGAVVLATGSQAASKGQDPQKLRMSLGLNEYVGSMHEHSGYSDGWAGSTPETFFASGKKFGLDFMGSSDHSDFLVPPISTSQYCIPTDPDQIAEVDPASLPSCILADPSPAKSLNKWQATEDYAKAATTKSFTAFRGLEWTSDTFGHINVYFSKNMSNAKLDGGTEVSMKPFYSWLNRRPEQGGGSDGLAVFNHPGAKDDPVLPLPQNFNWSDFAYDPTVADSMVGMETFNDNEEYGTSRDHSAPAEGYYVHALDKGWHLAPYGAEDLGHRRSDDWGGPSWAKTVMLAKDRSESSLRSAMEGRHVYSVRYGTMRLGFTVDDAIMGSELTKPLGSTLPVRATVSTPGKGTATLELVTSKGKVLATGLGKLSVNVKTSKDQKYYFVRAKIGKDYVAYSAPVWVSPNLVKPQGEWLAGDLHVHTCYSHDVYCPTSITDPTSDVNNNTELDEFYTLGETVGQRFTEARIKGLDYLAITDHHDNGAKPGTEFFSPNDPGFGTQGVMGIAGYENSLHGHAQMLGAKHYYDDGKSTAADVNRVANELRKDGGVFQINHPWNGELGPMKGCNDTKNMDWEYGYDVKPDTLEVWNIGELLQPPLPGGTNNVDTIPYWECMLDKGWHVGATGGSDSHWLTLSVAQGVGNPTTWVYAKDRSPAGVLAALKAGRTSVSMLPPLESAVILHLEADRDRDGVYESLVGDTVAAGTPMRVYATGLLKAGMVTVRAGDKAIVDQQLLPTGEITFTAPKGAKWAHAKLELPDLLDERGQVCDPVLGSATTYCRTRLLLRAQTSAIYITG